MMCMSTLVDALRIWKKTDKFQSYFKTVKAIVWILTVMMKLSYTGELAIIAGKSDLGTSS